MADNITLNAGTGGSVVATDEVTRATVVQHVQYVKLMNGTDAAIDVIAGDATNGLDVDVTRVSGNVTVVQATAANLNVTAALAAGTNNIGDVDVLSLVPGTGATALGKAIDSAAGATDTGVALLAVRDDTLSTLTPVDGDYVPLRVDSTGALHCRLTSGGIAGKAEDAAHTDGDEGVVMLAVRRDTAAVGSGTDGDYSTINVDASGRVHVNVGNTVTVASHAVTNAGTFAVQVDGSALTALQVIDNPVVVDDAAFTPATTSVMMAGFQADETSPDSVNEGDAGAARMSLDRKIYVIAHEETSTIYQNGTARTPAFASIDAATSGDNTLLAAQGAGNKIRVHQLFLVAAGTTTVRFESGAGGTALTGQMNLVANTGFVLPYSPIGWFETAANTLLNLELSAAVSVDGNFAYTVVT